MYWKHETAVVDPGAEIGAGTKIWHFSHVSADQVRIGENCSLGHNCFVGCDVTIGSNVRVQNNVSIYDHVTLEDDVLCGPSMVFVNLISARAHIPPPPYKATLVKRGASIGANATILCGIEIGRYAFIGAGSVVTDSVPDFALVIGVPARHVGWMCQCGVRLPLELGENNKNLICQTCGCRYRVDGSGCRILGDSLVGSDDLGL